MTSLLSASIASRSSACASWWGLLAPLIVGVTLLVGLLTRGAALLVLSSFLLRLRSSGLALDSLLFRPAVVPGFPGFPDSTEGSSS